MFDVIGMFGRFRMFGTLCLPGVARRSTRGTNLYVLQAGRMRREMGDARACWMSLISELKSRTKTVANTVFAVSVITVFDDHYCEKSP